MMSNYGLSHIHHSCFLFAFSVLSIIFVGYSLRCDSDCLVGNSNMLSVIDDTGSIKVIRWERIWGENQLSKPVSLRTTDGIVKGSTLLLLKSQNSLYSIYSHSDFKTSWQSLYAPAPISVASGVVVPLSIKWEQEIFVYPVNDLLCLKLSLSGEVETVRRLELLALFNFLLSPPPIYNNPFFQSPDEFRRCNIIFWSDELSALVFFRPFSLSRQDRFRLEQSMNRKESISKTIRKFEDGVYVAVFSPGNSKIIILSSDGNILLTPSNWDLTTFKFSPPQHTVEGTPCSLYIPLSISPQFPSDTQTVDFHIYLVFAHNYLELADVVNQVKSKLYEELLTEAREYWKNRYNGVKNPTLSQSDWVKLTLATEPTTKAVLPSPGESNMISIIDTSLLVFRCLSQKMHNIAKDQLLFWSQVAKKAKETGRFAIPSMVYPDGTPACPEYMQDISANGIYLYLCNQVVSSLPLAERNFLSDIWDVIYWAGNQIAIWHIPGEYLPSPSYSDSAELDLLTANQLLRILIGLRSALSLCKLANSVVPEEWVQREKEIQLWFRMAIIKQAQLPVFCEGDIDIWKSVFDEKDVVWSLPVVNGKKRYTLGEFVRDNCFPKTTILNKDGN